MIFDITTLDFFPEIGDEILLVDEGKPVAKLLCEEEKESGEDGCRNCYFYVTSACGHIENNISPFNCHSDDRLDCKCVNYKMVENYV